MERWISRSPWNQRHLNLCGSWQQCLARQLLPVPTAFTTGQWWPTRATPGQLSLPRAWELLGASARRSVRSAGHSSLPACFSTGKQGGHSVLTACLQSLTLERHIHPSGHCSQDTLQGPGALVRPVPAGPLGIHRAGLPEKLVRSVQGDEPVLPNKGCCGHWGVFQAHPCPGPSLHSPSLVRLGLIFPHFAEGGSGIHGAAAPAFPRKPNSQAPSATSEGSPQMPPCIWASSGSPALSPWCELPAELDAGGCLEYSPPRTGSAQKAPSWSGRCWSLPRALTRCPGLCSCSESH